MTVIGVKVNPNARVSRLHELEDGTWLAEVKAPPIDGRANEELIGLVARHFGRRRAQVSVKSGASGRRKVGLDVTLEQAQHLARLTALSMLGSLKRELGDLDRISAWLRVFGMVNSAPGFNQQPNVINGFSNLIVELYGPQRGRHARSAVGMAELPFRIAVEIEAEVEIDG